ncbi:MAG: aminotransferase class I/II-fold pyridoxal phosphate-dependent enzyme [Alkalibacterium sp.]|nr:aminotransferase class I/II-fold pyridoxal phosphate-dependent enzyme [Alkalibacterium sp.]
MKTWPLESISVKEAVQKQYKFVDSMTRHFSGEMSLTRGDLGVVPGLNKPETTQLAEKVIADFFGSEDAMLIRGAGTTAIRQALYAAIKPNQTLLVHDAPIYPTTQVSIDMLNLTIKKIDFNDIEKVKKFIKTNTLSGVLIQLTRQKPDDSYDSNELINLIRSLKPTLPIITDDNYAVMKIPEIGCEMGANLSCFSLFKLLGPEGIGCIVGDEEYISQLKKDSYSGGLQVQGHEALDALKCLTYAPVALALSAETSSQVCKELNTKAYPQIKEAFIANAQSKVVLIEFTKPIAKEVLLAAEKLGAAPYPIGAESKYEIVPMFYRVSNTFLQSDPSLSDCMIRVNPMRAGADTVLRIVKEAIKQVNPEE